MIFTSDKEFFDNIGEEETKRYFETAYNFVAEYKNLGEQYIMSAKVHMDEETPHMHLIFYLLFIQKIKKKMTLINQLVANFRKQKIVIDNYKMLSMII